jgi:hypothetical protein
VVVEVDPELARAEPDEEVQDLLQASAGPNLGVDYLPGSFTYDPAADAVDPDEAAAVVWFDALVENVDRSWRNPNLLAWHGRLWCIDHGAALWFAHDWTRRASAPTRPYAHVTDHVLLVAAGPVDEADRRLAPLLGTAVLEDAVAAVPEAWLVPAADLATADDVRAAYVEVLSARLASREAWVPALEVARARV